MRYHKTEPLGNVLNRFVKAIGGDRKLKEIHLKKSWGNIMGAGVEQQTQYVYIKDDVYFVKLRSSVVKHELSMMKSIILTRLNQEAGEELIREIVFL